MEASVCLDWLCFCTAPQMIEMLHVVLCFSGSAGCNLEGPLGLTPERRANVDWYLFMWLVLGLVMNSEVVLNALFVAQELLKKETSKREKAKQNASPLVWYSEERA